MSDAALAAQVGRFIKEKRMSLSITQEQLAHDAGISRSTLSLLEKGETVTLATFFQVMRILDQLHFMDAFVITPQISPIQLAKLEMKKRTRVRKQSKGTTSTEW